MDILFEDAFVTRDSAALTGLFADGAVLVAEGAAEARGLESIASVSQSMWERDRTYLAGARRVLQARDTALLVADGTLNVARRSQDGSWRFAISLLAFPHLKEEER